MNIDLREYRKFLDTIEDMLARSMDAEETTPEESIDLIYDVLGLIEEEHRRIEHELIKNIWSTNWK